MLIGLETDHHMLWLIIDLNNDSPAVCLFNNFFFVSDEEEEKEEEDESKSNYEQDEFEFSLISINFPDKLHQISCLNLQNKEKTHKEVTCTLFDFENNRHSCHLKLIWIKVKNDNSLYVSFLSGVSRFN